MTESQEDSAVEVKPVLRVYPILDSFAGKIRIPSQEAAKVANKTLTIVILDRSGSMGSFVEKLLEKVLPVLFQNIGYDEQDPITLITFDSTSEVYLTTVGEISKLGIHCRGCTCMSGALEKLKEILGQNHDVKEHIVSECKNDEELPIRLLTLSDGILDDQEQTVGIASTIAPLLSGRLVNSKAVRYFTSGAQPDTRGLASVLQFNNISSEKCGLIDLESRLGIEETAAAMSELFADDGLGGRLVTLSTDTDVISRLPWHKQSIVKETRLPPGDHIIWLHKLPEKVYIDGVEVAVEDGGEITYENMGLIEPKIYSLVDHVKLLKVVNSDDAIAEVNAAKEFISNWLCSLKQTEIETNTDASAASLQSRLKFFKNTTRRRVIGAMYELARVANDEKVHALNSAQQASYLRTVGQSKAARGVAQRAYKEGFEFLEVLQSEVEAMSKNLDKLADIDDSNHATSFYSCATTLMGIKSLCELFEEKDAFNQLDAMELLQLANIVGVACQAVISDYPDPSTWFIKTIFPGCYISMSDVVVAFEQSGQSSQLTVPAARDQEITCVVPYFEDERIQRFLMKYAPNLLDYTCSLGMRKLLAGVPLTFYYTMAAGVSSLAMEIDKNKFEANINCFCQLVRNMAMPNAWQKRFDDILEHIEKDKERSMIDGKLMSMFLDNNRAQNLLGLMIRLAKEGRLMSPVLPRILRALYATEVYYTLRKSGNDDSNLANLRAMLGIDLERYKTYEGDLFEDVVNPQFHSEHHLDKTKFRQCARMFAHANYISLWPELIDRVFSSEDPVVAIKALPEISRETFCQAFGLTNYDFKAFIVCNIVQALVFSKTPMRYDKDKQRMTIIDLGVQEAAKELVADYIRQFYREDYLNRVAVKQKKERDILAALLVKRLLASKTIDEFKQLLSNGTEDKGKHYHFTDIESIGCQDFVYKLADPSADVPERNAKVKVFMSGRDGEEIVWNNGSALRRDLDIQRLKEAFLDGSLVRDKWQALIKSKSNVHSYTRRRKSKGSRRQRHNNEKPSYWAFGFKSIDSYFAAVSEDERQLYQRVHRNCCSLWDKNAYYE